MIETISESIELFILQDEADIRPAADAFMAGKITLLRVGSVFSFVLNPKIAGLAQQFNVLKERHKSQTMSVVCSHEYARQFVDKDRVNQDFYRIPAHLCGKAIIRIPIDLSAPCPFPHDAQSRSMQFLSFEAAHPLRSAFARELASRGCDYMLITSGNLHGAPTIGDLASAKVLAALFNMKAAFLNMQGVKTVVTDIPSDKSAHQGSYMILSFCNPKAIEVKRLVNKADQAFTEQYLQTLFAGVPVETPVIFALDG